MSHKQKRHYRPRASSQKPADRLAPARHHSLMAVQSKLGLFIRAAKDPHKPECHAYLKGKPLGYV